MNLDKQLIKDSFVLFADLDGANVDTWVMLLDDAESQITSALRENADLGLNMERLCLAAAAVAYFDYAIVTSSKSGASAEIRVGDISVRGSGDISAASEVRDHFLSKISDLITLPTGFVFKSTGVGQ